MTEKTSFKTLWEKYETDPRKECDGVPVVIDGITFFVRRAGGNNRAYKYVLAIEARKYVEQLSGENRDESAAFAAHEAILQVAFAQTVLVGWSSNMIDRQGKPLAFSIDAALDLVRACPAIWDELKGAAIDDDRFKPDQDGEALAKLSFGGANGATASTS